MIGNPFETTLALHYLIFDGVLERHPNLKLLAVHGGGYLGAYSGRIDHAWCRPDCKADLPHPPTHYLKKVFVDSVVFTPQQLAALVEIFGAGHVLMGTDYPFDMAESDPLESSRFRRHIRFQHDLGDRRKQCPQAAGTLSGSPVLSKANRSKFDQANAAPMNGAMFRNRRDRCAQAAERRAIPGLLCPWRALPLSRAQLNCLSRSTHYPATKGLHVGRVPFGFRINQIICISATHCAFEWDDETTFRQIIFH